MRPDTSFRAWDPGYCTIFIGVRIADHYEDRPATPRP